MVIWELLGRLLGKQNVKKQSLTYTNIQENVYIDVNFKRAGNVVECISSVKMPANLSNTKASTEFIGTFPSWAYPDMNFTKETIRFGNNTYKGMYMMQINKDGRFTVLYNNLDNTETTFVLQFTYIVDDSEISHEIGDVDGNGIIDEVDLRLIQNNIMGLLDLTKKQTNAADMNQDENVTSSDYIILKNQLGL